MQAAQNSAQIFIGINLKCNSCHDSFISKWTLKDAYRSRASSVKTSVSVCIAAMCARRLRHARVPVS